MKTRIICPNCNKRPVAVNYHYKQTVYYKKKCDKCLRLPKRKAAQYIMRGYKKKHICEKCGFKPLYQQLLVIHHIDLDPSNFNWNNLKTACLNCDAELKLTRKGWSQGDLIPDL